MTERLSSTTLELADRSRELAAAHGLCPGALGAVLLALVDRLGAPFGIKEIATGRYVYVNPHLAALVGLSPEQLLGCTDAELLGAEAAGALRGADQTAAGQAQPHTSEQRIGRDRERREFTITRVPLCTEDESPARHLCSVWIESTAAAARDAQLAQALQQLEQQQASMESLRRESQDQALRDSVTGLYQRVHFEDQLRREVDLSSREHREFALVSIALDPLGEAARAHGAPARQRVLEALGRLLRGNTRAMDASCRLDEDRFAVLLSGVGLATAHSRMEGLRRQCATQIVVLEGKELGFTVSMGVSSFPHTAHSQDALLAASDEALEEARRRGGNHVTLASIRFDAGT